MNISAASQISPTSTVGVFLSGALLVGCCLAPLGLKVFRPSTREKGNGLPLPPGPKPFPFFGNALNIPINKPWETFAKWTEEFGEIVHVSVFNQSIIVLNSPKAVYDLLEKRSAIYSERPRLPLVAELTGLDWNLTLMPYTDNFKKHRRVFASEFGPGTVKMFNPAQDFATVGLLKRLADKPEEFLEHIRLFMAQDILLSTYGIIPKTRDDKFVVLAERTISAFSELVRPGVFLVDAFPILKKVPSWVPGAFSLKMAEDMARDTTMMKDVPFLETKKMMSSGSLPMPCFVSDLLESREKGRAEMTDLELEAVVSACGNQAYGGGSDTCVSALTAFVLAMSLYPEAQKKAQAELDAIIGTTRLPTLEDKKNLPYVTAIMKEVLRWHVVVPQALPHMLKEDDVYNGYRIPKGSIIVGNSWGILHDPELYPEPMKFIPERYFDAEGQLDFSKNDPAKFAFGYGRRFCPGFYFAENALHLAISRILAVFNISVAKDKDGKPVPAVHLPMSGMISHPSAFKCAITPRSDEAVVLIRQASENVSQVFKFI